ncbi:MAG: nucleotidyltransferase family protein, partial [Candidatus Eremiobacteraeota bacterium]|nr:nucleotidyltransferase family protein [Candidatus Eremiobacteraeota bacterium]
MSDAGLDAVVLAAGRLRAQDAQRFGVEVKALLPDAQGTTLLRRLMHALRGAPGIARIIVVGPKAAHGEAAEADVWIPERATGEENALAGIEQVRAAYTLLCASDLPFVCGDHIADFLARAAGSDVAYPVFERSEFLAAFPGGRTRFARLAKTYWTGGSLCYMETALALRNAPLVRRAFSSRKSLP